MDYQQRLQKFITSQHLSNGLRVTSAVVIPALFLYYFGWLTQAIGVCFGALFVSLTDNPGPFHHRRNGIIGSILINLLVILTAGVSLQYQWLLIIELVLFSMVFSLISVYGNRVNAIGAIAIIVFVLHLNPQRLSTVSVYQDAFYMTIGGIWYLLLSLTTYTIRPYKQVQLLLGDCLMEIADYLRIKSRFYKSENDFSSLYTSLMEHQIHIHQSQAELREMLFKTRSFLNESTRKGQSLVMMFLDSIDLLERIMTSQQDYNQLHQQFDSTQVLEKIHNHIVILSNELHNIGLAVQGGYSYKSNEDLAKLSDEVMKVYTDLRKEKLSSKTLEAFISLRHILYSLQDITERIKRIEAYTSYDKPLRKADLENRELQHFVSRQQFDWSLFRDNISIKSNTFRHAVRLTVALLAGYLISLFFSEINNGYWILLTIATIMKPAFSITKKRNIQRLTGTLFGVAIGFGIIYLTGNNLILLITMIVSMIIAYSFLKLQYTVSVIAITLYVIMSLHFLNPNGLQSSLSARVIDTLIGSVIAYIVSTFVLPVWESQQISKQLKAALIANKNYFVKVAYAFAGKIPTTLEYKIARKDAFIALANLSDSFQKMMSEPKEKQQYLESYHQLVSATHVLTSHIASLSYYAQRFKGLYTTEEFVPIIKQIERQMNRAVCIIEDESCTEDAVANKLPAVRKLQHLLDVRKKDLEAGVDSDMETIKKTLSNLKTITDQFQLISATTVDKIKVLQKMYS